MRITKLLSVFLAVLMLFSCVAGALATGVAAEETEAPAEYEYSYSDPREGATKIYYALGGGATADEAGLTSEDTVLKSAWNLYAVLTDAAVRTQAYEAGSVLVVKFKDSLTAFSDGKNTGKSGKTAFGAMTIFREDNTKLPIVIEGIEADKASTLKINKTDRLEFANDYFFTNVTFSVTSGEDAYIQAGSGLVTFHDVNLPTPAEGKKLYFNADAYGGDTFYNWQASNVAQPEKITANDKDGDGFVDTGFIFGKGTSVTTANTFITCAGVAATPSGTYGKSDDITASGSDLTAENIAAFQGLMQRGGDPANEIEDVIVYGNADYLTEAANRQATVRPFEVDAKIIIDNGNENSDTADFNSINMFQVLGKPVGQAEVTVYSGNVANIYADNNGGGTTAEFFYGDCEINVLGGHVIGTVQGFCDAFLIGDFSITVGGDAVVTGDVMATRASSLNGYVTGNYTFTLEGNASINNYSGASVWENRSVSGEDAKPATNNINGGTINGAFFGSRYYTYADIVNNITAGILMSTFHGGVQNKSTEAINITNNICGITGQAADYEEGTSENALAGANYPQFKGLFYAENANKTGAVAGDVKTIVSDGYFEKMITKKQADTTVASSTFEVVSTKATDIVKFGSNTDGLEIDSFSMNGGRIDFYQAKITVNNATGSVVVRNTGSWADTDTYSILFVGAAGNLTVTTTQAGTDETNVGKVVEENGDIYVTDGYVPAPTTVAPASATVIMDDNNTALGIRFLFLKEEVNAIDGFTYDILMNGTSVVDPEEGLADYDETYYSVVTYAVGYPNFNTAFTFGGSLASDVELSVATIAALGAEQLDGAWQTWAQALVNLCGANEEGFTSAYEAEAKEYDFSLEKGEKQADVTGLKADFIMTNVTGVRFTLTLSTMPTDLMVTFNAMDWADKAVVDTDAQTITIDLYFAAQNMEENFALKVKDGYEGGAYFEFRGSVATLAQMAAETDEAAEAFLFYIQAAAVAANA